MTIGDQWEHTWLIESQLWDRFVALSEDRNPMHTDSSFAKSFGFKEKVVHGNILNIFISYFIGEMLPIKNVVILGQSIKYAQPIYVDSVVTLKSVLSNRVDSVSMYDFDFVFEIGQNKVASGKVQIKEL